jgi:threonine/homoserine/homoserine lactone efflux protein
MVDTHAYWFFIGAVVVLVLAPGPDMAYMLTRTIAQGRKAGVVAVLN